MTVTAPGRPTGRQAMARRALRPGLPRVLLGVAGLIVLLSIVRAISGATDITSGGTVVNAVALAVPIGMAGLGGLWAERAGVVNIGLEGMMILGTWGPAGPATSGVPGRVCWWASAWAPLGGCCMPSPP